jgi:hypothetical protein
MHRGNETLSMPRYRGEGGLAIVYFGMAENLSALDRVAYKRALLRLRP